ncbi:uncharacterized protein MICPUCDRAFT_55195 [Micromonas pusilla CCMP1545]|uniref:Predicted protein n=1 Tax=Micromonas pusilla (strain CCMP1545) TaxID=564608 RepID=C1MK29_MICPC|nr:uncharacterized protein MICPUCDRAFT_55195 [Micromonas pusilla CCMP1545]EEH59694.1 predicted protein [Micromonas pusilla CCMP1545]|eukprot:XP_003056318.1 predicted protein [Micromonas pusilla CCMP1545]
MAARSKRLTRPPAKRRDADDAMFDEAEVQRALRASVKLQKRTSSTCMPSCPTFHPTPEQFRDPFAYIKSITSEGIAAGIVKIVPPEGATRARGRVVVVVDDDDYDDDDARSFRFGVERRSPSLHPVRFPVPRACADGARWRPPFNANAGGGEIPFDTKLQAVHRLQEGVDFEDGKRYTRESFRAMADSFAAAWMHAHLSLDAEVKRLMIERGFEEADARARAVEEEFWYGSSLESVPTCISPSSLCLCHRSSRRRQ